MVTHFRNSRLRYTCIRNDRFLQSVPGIIYELVSCDKFVNDILFRTIYKTHYLTSGHRALAVILCLCLTFFGVINSLIVLTKPKKPKKFGVQYFRGWRWQSLTHPVPKQNRFYCSKQNDGENKYPCLSRSRLLVDTKLVFFSLLPHWCQSLMLGHWTLSDSRSQI